MVIIFLSLFLEETFRLHFKGKKTCFVVLLYKGTFINDVTHGGGRGLAFLWQSVTEGGEGVDHNVMSH